MTGHRIEYEFEIDDLGASTIAERFTRSNIRKLNVMVFAGSLVASAGVFAIARLTFHQPEQTAFWLGVFCFVIVFPTAWVTAIRRILASIKPTSSNNHSQSSRFLFVDAGDQTLIFGNGFEENHLKFADITDLLVTPEYVKLIFKQSEALLIPRKNISSGNNEYSWNRR